MLFRSPEDLARHACLHHKFPSTGKLEEWPLSREGAAVEVELPPAVVASTLEPLIMLAEQGLGLACVPLFTVRRQIQSGQLVTVLDDYLRNNRPFRILWPANRHTSPKVEAFVNFMARNLFREQG